MANFLLKLITYSVLTLYPSLPSWERAGAEGEHTMFTPTFILPIEGEDNPGNFHASWVRNP